MKILVPIKHVAALDPDFELLDERTVDPEHLDWSINEWDEYAVEAAVQLRDAAGGGEVVVVTISDEETTEGLTSSLARGADRAIRVWDRRLEGADPIAIAHVLSGVVDREAPDLVLCGVQSSDAGHGATGVAAAALAGLPHVAVVSAVEIDGAAAVRVTRELEDGWVERLRVTVPALLTLQTGINEPRYVTLRALNEANVRPVETLGLADLSLTAVPEAHQVVGLTAPSGQGRAEMLSADPDEAAARIAAILTERIGGAAPVATP
ncbi:MAG TPA: electron transfer flavoprotein subunit beta/FixA family protein [Baekduia sp.]|nr:electron transfer flavoprotein subunit beta/FixA family protein [Baekduia sp.]